MPGDPGFGFLAPGGPRWPSRPAAATKHAQGPTVLASLQVHRSERRGDREQLLRLEGLHCAACVHAVEEALLAQPGVLAASVSLMAASGKVPRAARAHAHTHNARTRTLALAGGLRPAAC